MNLTNHTVYCLNAWIIDKEEEMDWFLQHNFDYITTDNPERLLEKTTKKK